MDNRPKNFDIDQFISRAVMKASGAGRPVTLWVREATGECRMDWTDEDGPGVGWTRWANVGPAERADDGPPMPPDIQVAVEEATKRAAVERRSMEVWSVPAQVFHVIPEGKSQNPPPGATLVATVGYSEKVEVVEECACGQGCKPTLH